MSEGLKGVSIVICTYNGKSKLGPTLSHIAAQKRVENLGVEVLIVDNASTDGTEQFAQAYWKSLNTAIPLRVIQEPRAGKTNASQTGFKASTYEFIIICDDDNWLCDDYVSKALAIMGSDPAIGVLGGRGIAIFEGSEPEWFNRHLRLFAVGKQCEKDGDVTEQIDFLWGAGMVFRKSAWNKMLQMNYSFFLNYEATGKSNWGGEDVEMFEVIRMMGYRIWYNDSLTFEHFMPADRMTYRYLKNKFYGAGGIRIYLRAFLYCRTNNEMPGRHLKYPFWLDRWQYQMTQYIKQVWGHLFESKEKVSDDYLKFIALKGELHELWSLKGGYTAIFEKILAVKKRISESPELKAPGN